MRFTLFTIVLSAVLAVAFAQDGYWAAPIYTPRVCPAIYSPVCGVREHSGYYGKSLEYRTFANKCKWEDENDRLYYTAYKLLITKEGFSCAELGHPKEYESA